MITLGLASNYSFGRTLRHLFAFGTQQDSLALCSALAARYHVRPADVALFHTGRSALAAALQAVAAPGTPVILPGLTCIAVVRAIKAAGCTPVFSDIDPQTLQYDYKTLDKTLKLCYNDSNGSKSPAFPDPNAANTTPDTDGTANHQTSRAARASTPTRHPVILIQNTLGITLDAKKLEDLAAQYHATIVEDLAHCAGRFYPDGREVGTIGAAAALSFGKGKAIDTISGGALILRRDPSAKPLNSKTPESTQTTPDLQPTQKPRLAARLRDRWYPVFGGLSRTFWRIGLGKALLALCVKLRWIEKSADAELSLTTRLTHWQAKLAHKQLAALPTSAPSTPPSAAPLREHLFVKDRAQLLDELKRNGYDFSETWYDVPVSPSRYADEADFPADRCPATVRVAEHIINLPTWYPEAKLARARAIIQPYEVKL